MGNLIKMERYKLFHNIFFWLLAIGMPVLGFFSGSGYRNYYLAHDSTPIQVESFSGVFNAMVADTLVLLVAVCGLLGWLIGREFSLRTISSEVASGNKRFDIFMSKTIVYLVAFNVIMILYSLMGAISQIGYFGVGDLGNNILNILRTTVYTVIFQSVLYLIVITLAFILRSGVKTAIAGPLVAFGIMIAFCTIMTEDLPVVLNYANPMYRFREITAMGSYFSTSGIINIPALLVAVVWLGACSIIIWKNFAKSDLK
ncbi:MAG: ABC transporter permease [Clostridiales bacterium]|nr:ABC transporter permease [Clostridiales bacterium]